MFEFVRAHTRILQFVLVLLIFPSFVLFGIQGYSRLSGGANATVAKVAGGDITQAELDVAHRRQIEMVRSRMPNVDASVFDTPQMRRNTLDGLVRERVMNAAASNAGYVTTNDRIEQVLRTDPQFAAFRKEDGSLNKEMLQQVLISQGMSVDSFIEGMRQELSARQVQLGVVGTVIAPATAASSAIDAMFQQREVQIQRFDTKDYLAKVNPTQADAEAYFRDPAHAAQFKTPERADIEYIVLDLDSVKKGIAVSEDELRKTYDANPKNFTSPEERRAAHILIKAPIGMPADERAKAKAKADALLAELTQKPSAFSDVARKNSQDIGSAQQGGDVDLFIARGDTDKAYEDALFTLQKPGDLSPVVQTKDGYYILQLKAVRGGEKRSFDSVRADIEQQIKTDRAQAKYSATVADFSNLIEQADDLKSVADKLQLQLRTAKGVTRTPAPDATGPLASPKLLDALFSADSLRNKRNLESIETAPNVQVSARIVSYSPAATPPLADVLAKVHEEVSVIQANALAHKEGEARLAAARQAPAADLGVPVQTISRAQAREVPRPLIDAALRVPAATLPAVAGADLGEGGYAVVCVVKVLGRDPIAADPARASAQYAQAWSAAESQAYYEALKRRFKVDMSKAPSADTAASAAAK